MKKIFLLIFVICNFLKNNTALEIEFLRKPFEWGPYKPDYLYAWTENNDNPMLFGFSYLTIKTSSDKNLNNLNEVLDKKKFESFEILQKNTEILLDNVENLHFFSKSQKGKTNEFIFNDGLGTHEKNIRDNDLGIEINIKSLKKPDGFIVNLDFDGTSSKPKKEYYSLFFYIYSPNTPINRSLIEANRDIIINNYLRVRLMGSECINDFIGFKTHSLQIDSDFSSQIDEILLDILDNNLVLPKDSSEDNSQKNLLFLQAFIPTNLKCRLQMSQANSVTSLLYSRFLDEKLFDQEIQKAKELFSIAVSRIFLHNKTTTTANYTNFISKLPVSFSNFLGSLAHFSGKLPFIFSFDDSPLFKAGRSYSMLSFEPYSLFSHGFALYLTCKFDMVICSALLENLMDQVNFAGWLPIHLYFPAFSSFQKEKETLTAPPTFTMPIEFIGKMLYLNPEIFDPSIKDLLLKLLRFQIYPKLQLIFKYYLHAFRRIPGKYESLDNAYFHWNDGIIGDYPRILPKDNTVEHLDLICWIADTAIVLTQLASQLGNFADAEEYNSMLKDFILREFPKKYIDFNDPLLVLKDIISVKYVKNRLESKTFSERIGFSSLMPLVKGLLESTDGLLENTIDYLLDDKLLWSPFGVKIIDGQDSKGGNFISVECNWLILKGLRSFYWENSKARDAYKIIREALLENVMKHYQKEGEIFEKYRTENGNPVGEPSKIAAGLTILIINEDFY